MGEQLHSDHSLSVTSLIFLPLYIHLLIIQQLIFYGVLILFSVSRSVVEHPFKVP